MTPRLCGFHIPKYLFDWTGFPVFVAEQTTLILLASRPRRVSQAAFQCAALQHIRMTAYCEALAATELQVVNFV